MKHIFIILSFLILSYTSLFSLENNNTTSAANNNESVEASHKKLRKKALERARGVDFSFYGIKFGFGASNLVEIVKYRKDNESLRGDITLHAGFRYGYFKGLVGVIVDLEWQRIFAQDISNQIKLDYLSLNTMAVFNFDNHYFIGGGLFFAYLLKSRINDSSASSYFNKTDFGIMLSLGGSYKFIPSNLKIFFGVEAKFGLINVLNAPLPASRFDNLTTFSVTIISAIGF